PFRPILRPPLTRLIAFLELNTERMYVSLGLYDLLDNGYVLAVRDARGDWVARVMDGYLDELDGVIADRLDHHVRHLARYGYICVGPRDTYGPQTWDLTPWGRKRFLVHLEED